MFRIIFSVLLSTCLAGCETIEHRPLTADSSAQLRGKTVVSVRYPAPNFSAFTPGSAIFGNLGKDASISGGKEIIKDAGIEDPAQGISRGLEKELAVKRQVKALPPIVSTQYGVEELIRLARGDADLILDVRTLEWKISYYRFNWARYTLIYMGRLRLIDAASKTVIAETLCTYQSAEPNSPTYDELLANNAAVLKQYNDSLVTACINVLAKEVLNL